MVLIICTKNESNLTKEVLGYGSGRTKSEDRRTDGQTEWTDGRTDDAKTTPKESSNAYTFVLAFS